LVTLFGATNELPEEDELAALYDRFLLRFVLG
jgi:MoxR-like ATPase